MNTKLLHHGAAFLAAVLLLALFIAFIPQQAAAASSQAELWQAIEDQSETFDGGDGRDYLIGDLYGASVVPVDVLD